MEMQSKQAVLKNMRNGDTYWDHDLVKPQELENRLTKSESIVYYREAPSAVPTPEQIDVLVKIAAARVKMQHWGVMPEWGHLESFELNDDAPCVHVRVVPGEPATFLISRANEEVEFVVTDATHITGLLDDLAYLVSSHRVVETIEQETGTLNPNVVDEGIQLRLKWSSGPVHEAQYARNSVPSNILTFCQEVQRLTRSCHFVGGEPTHRSGPRNGFVVPSYGQTVLHEK